MSTPSNDARENARCVLAAAQKKLEQLQSIDPFFIDLSLRENAFGSRIGQTLEDKLNILPLVREFGFQNILLGTLDYARPDELEVDDDFMTYLRDNQIDMTGGFAFTDIGIADTQGTFTPSRSMLKMQAYGVPNTLHEIYLSKEGMQSAGYDLATVQRSLPQSVEWVVNNCRGDRGGRPRIFVNVVDGCDAFQEDFDAVATILTLIANMPVDGLSFEDDRGTFMPFQVGAFVAAARPYLPAPLKILVHMHSGAGFENASVIEALLNGADGVWGGLPKRAAIIGHGSLGEVIANLARIQNPNMQQYQLSNLLPLATQLQQLDDELGIPDDLPIFGKNAYRMTLDFFRQIPTRVMDLPPEVIGGTGGYRICPLGSDEPIVRGRLAEVTGQPPDSFPEPVVFKMVQLMRSDLRQGTRIAYDDPEPLMQLYVRAGGQK